jgi:hypothetical protein
VVSHESDHGKIPPNHAMEDVNWVHERSRWVCKINGCIDSYTAKWLLHCHLDNKHGLHLEEGKFGCPSTCFGGPRQQYHGSMNVCILNNPHARQKLNEKKTLNQPKLNKWNKLSGLCWYV